MKPSIEGTEFGSITIAGQVYEQDVVIRLNGQVKKRKKKLSKAKFGASHKVSLEEAENIYEAGAERLIIGTGQTGLVELSKKKPPIFSARMEFRFNCFPHLRRRRFGMMPKAQL